MYLRWRAKLPAWACVVPLELPGRGARLAEPSVEDFEHLVAQLCDDYAPAMRGRYALFGHSMGALLAYAVAERQRARGQALPCALFVSGSAAPSCVEPTRIAARDDDALIADLHRRGGTPDEVFRSGELLQIALETLRADYRVCSSFRVRVPEPLPIALHVFGGTGDEITAEHLDAWRCATSGPFTLDLFDGGHFFIRQQEHRVLTAIRRELARHRSHTGRTAVLTG